MKNSTSSISKYFFVSLFVLLCVSGILLVLLQRMPKFEEYFLLFIWIHVVVICAGIYGLWRLGKLRSTNSVSLTSFLTGFPVWLIALAVPVAMTFSSLRSSSTFDLGETASGQKIYRKSWSTDQGHYYVRINGEKPVEISASEYAEHQRQSYEFFTRGWIFGLYILLVLWHYIWRVDKGALTAHKTD
jgi:hypothetical protein